MTNDLSILAEIILFLVLICLIAFLNFRRNIWASLLLVVFLTLLLIVVIVGFQKSPYHMGYVCLFPLVILSLKPSEALKEKLRHFLIFILLILELSDLLQSSVYFMTKYNAPNFYYLWGAILLLNINREFKLIMAGGLLALDMVISKDVGARGIVLFSCLAAYAVFVKRSASGGKLFTLIFLTMTVCYIYAFSISEFFGIERYIYDSASNYQRAFMNISALEYLYSHPITFDDISITSNFSYLRYSHDSKSLSVHSIYLAFGMFNGLIPAIIIYFCTLYMVTKTRGIECLPLAVFLMGFSIVGPDVTETRSAILIIAFLYLLSAKAKRVSVVRSLNASIQLRGT